MKNAEPVSEVTLEALRDVLHAALSVAVDAGNVEERTGEVVVQLDRWAEGSLFMTADGDRIFEVSLRQVQPADLARRLRALPPVRNEDPHGGRAQ